MGVGPLSVGLATGIDFGQIIESLINLEKRPIDLLKNKIDINTIKQQALDQLNGLALSAKLSMFDLASASTFDSKVASSSNEAILTAVASTAANLGNQTIQVVKVAEFGQSLSTGVADQTKATIGAGELVFEMGARRLDRSTNLEDLNAGAGVQRGKIFVTDSTGKGATFDLSSAITLDDVLGVMNDNNLGITVAVNRQYSGTAFTGTGSLSNGMNLVITNNGGNSITFSEDGSGTTLKDLGFSTAAQKTIANAASSAGDQIMKVTEATKLSKMNDGFGIQTNASGTKDLRFYVVNGSNQKKSVEVDLSGSTDVGDVLNKINLAIQTSSLNLYAKASLSSNGLRIEFTGSVSEIRDINDSRAASELGLTKLTASGSVLQGEQLVAELNSSLLRNLRGGNGIDGMDTGVIRAISKAGRQYFLNFGGAVSVKDVMRIIDKTQDTGTTSTDFTTRVSLNGTGIDIKDSSTGTQTLRIEDVSGTVARQLGLETTYFTAKALNNVFDYSIDSTGLGRSSTVYLSPNDLPEGITENDLVGRLVQHRYRSQRDADDDIAGTTTGSTTETGVESAKIIAFEKAPDPFKISALNAKTSSVTLTDTGTDNDGNGTNDDRLTDSTGLDSTKNSALDKDKLIGATVTVYTTTGAFSSTIQNYDSTNKRVTLSDNVISQGIGSGNSIQSYGYTITYNHKLVLSYPDDTVVSAGDSAAASINGGLTVFTDTTNITSANAQGFDLTRIEGATLMVTKSDGTTFSGRISDFNLTGAGLDPNSFTLTSTSGTLVTADITANGYKIIYNPLQHTQHDSAVYPNNTFLDDIAGANDVFSIVGVEGNSIKGKNVENKMMSVQTALADLNGGEGVGKGKFLITSGGTAAEIDLSQSTIQTVGDLITEIQSKISGAIVSINDRGDGLRIFNSSTSSLTNTGVVITEVNNGLAAANLNLLGNVSSMKNVAGTRSTDFASVKGTNFIADGNINTLQIAELYGMNRADLIGSRVSYVDSTSKLVHGLITDFGSVVDTTNGNHGLLTVAGLVYEDGSDASGVATAADSKTISVTLKKDLEFEKLGTAARAVTAYNATTGVGTIFLDITETAIKNLTEEQLVGNIITLSSNSSTTSKGGQTAIVTDYNIATGDLTFLAQDSFATAGQSADLYIAKDMGYKRHISGGGITTSSSYIRSLASSGFTSASATVAAGTTSKVIFSDNFSNLDRRKVIGSLVTITDAADSSREGHVAVVRDYDSASRSITIDNFYTSGGVKDTTYTLAQNDVVALTFKDAVVGSAIRSSAQGSITISDTDANTNTAISAALANKKLIRVDGILHATEGTNGSRDKLIGATVTFSSTSATTALQKEVRTIVDVVTDYLGVQGNHVLVLDEELSSAAAVTDDFTISFPEMVASVADIDFFNGTITTAEDMVTAMGNRSFILHPVIDGTNQKKVTVEKTDTLTDIATKVNAANVGVKVNVMDDGSGNNSFRLSFDSSRSGSLSSVTVNSDISGFDVNTIRLGRDAKMVLGGDSGFSSVLTSHKNTVTTAIAGLTLNLKQASKEKITVSVDHDRAGIGEKATAFHESFNSLLTTVTQLTAHELEVTVTDEDGNERQEKQRGVLFGNFSADSLLNSIKSIFTSKVSGVASGQLTLLTEVGFKFNALGDAIEFDAGVFESALSSKFDQVKNLFKVTPNLSKASSLSITSGLLKSGFDIEHIRNGKTSSSGYAESGGGSNGIKVVTGDNSKYITFDLGTKKTLHGLKLYHHVPTNLTATYSVLGNQAVAGSATVKLEKAGIKAKGALETGGFTYNFIADNFGANGNQISLSFDGTSTVQQIIDSFNTANPSNKISFVTTGSTGTVASVIASGQSVSLSGGQDGYDVITDTLNLTKGANLIKNQVIGATLTVSNYKKAAATIGTATVTASNKGVNGNAVAFVFSGGLVSTAVATWNAANPSNTVVMTGTDNTPAASTVQLTGGDTFDTGSSTITDFDEATGKLTLSDNAVTTAVDIDSSGSETVTGTYTITSPSGKNISFAYNPTVEYRDPVSGEWKVYSDFSNIDRERLFVVFSGGLQTDGVRIRYRTNTGASTDFTTGGHVARLMEAEVLESQGLGSQINRIFDSMTNAQTGLIQSANTSLQQLNDTFGIRITRLQEQIENSRQVLIRQFSNLELIVSTMSSQSQFMTQQLNSLPRPSSGR